MSSDKTIIHEYAQNGDHRIAVEETDHNGRTKISEGGWAKREHLAYFQGMVGVTSFHEGLLPVGVVRINPIPHTVRRVQGGNGSQE